MRFFVKYGQVLPDFKFSDYKTSTWFEYYKNVRKFLEHKHPYYAAALALKDNRMDIYNLLRVMKDISPLIKIEKDRRSYYVRENKRNMVEGQLVKYVGEDKIIEEYISNKLISRETYKLNQIRKKERYNAYSEPIELIEWDSKGRKIYQEQKELAGMRVHKFFVDGSIRQVGYKFKGDKMREWITYKKDGSSKVEIYSCGKKIK